MPSGVWLFGGIFLALCGLRGVNHPEAVGSAGIWTSWVSPPVRRAATWIVLIGGLAMAVIGAFS